MGRPRLTLLCGVILAATAFATPAFAIDPADPLASETTTLAPVPVVVRSGPSWVAPQIASVVSAGLMGPDDPLTRGELHEAIVALGKPHRAPTDPNRIVTMRELDAQLVAAAGLLPSARQIRLAAQAGGLEPTDMLGTESARRSSPPRAPRRRTRSRSSASSTRAASMLCARSWRPSPSRC